MLNIYSTVFLCIITGTLLVGVYSLYSRRKPDVDRSEAKEAPDGRIPGGEEVVTELKQLTPNPNPVVQPIPAQAAPPPPQQPNTPSRPATPDIDSKPPATIPHATQRPQSPNRQVHFDPSPPPSRTKSPGPPAEPWKKHAPQPPKSQPATGTPSTTPRFMFQRRSHRAWFNVVPSK